LGGDGVSETWKYVVLTASGLVKTGPGVLHALVLDGGTADSTALAYDEVSGSGDELAAVRALAGTTGASGPLDVAFGVGLYVVLGGTAPRATVAYR
jgi:hypothetical protein